MEIINDLFPFFSKFGGKFGCKWLIKFLKSLCRRTYYGFLTLKKVEIIQKGDARAHRTSILKFQFHPNDLFQA